MVARQLTLGVRLIREDRTVWPKRGKAGTRRRKGCEWLALEVWRDVRPYVRALLGKSSIFALFWLCNYGFYRLTRVLTIDDLEGRLVMNVHSISTAVAFATFGVLFALDVISIRMKSHQVLDPAYGTGCLLFHPRSNSIGSPYC
jgi:hypothetical protein